MKKRNRNLVKRALSVCLSLSMCLGMLQITAFAVEGEEISDAEPMENLTVTDTVTETEEGSETLIDSTTETTSDGSYRVDTYGREDTEITSTVTTTVTEETETKEPDVKVEFTDVTPDAPENWYDKVEETEGSAKPENVEVTLQESPYGPDYHEWYTPQYGNYDEGDKNLEKVEAGLTYDNDGNPIGADGKPIESTTNGEKTYTVSAELKAESDIIVRDNLDKYTFGVTGDHAWDGGSFDTLDNGMLYPDYTPEQLEYMAHYPTYQKTEVKDNAVVKTTVRPVLENNKVIGYEQIVETTKIVANGEFKENATKPTPTPDPGFYDPSDDITEVKPVYAEDGKTVVSYEVTSVVRDENGEIVLGEDGEPVTETKTVERNSDPDASTLLGEVTQKDVDVKTEEVKGTLEGNKVETTTEVTQNIVHIDEGANASLSVQLTVGEIKNDTKEVDSLNGKYGNQVINVNCFTGASVTVMQPEENENTARAEFTFELEKSKFEEGTLLLTVNGKTFRVADRDMWSDNADNYVNVIADPSAYDDGKYHFSVDTTINLQDVDNGSGGRFELSLTGKYTMKDAGGNSFKVDANLHQNISVHITEIKAYTDVYKGTQKTEGTVDTDATATKTTTTTQETTTRFHANTTVEETNRETLQVVTRTERTPIEPDSDPVIPPVVEDGNNNDDDDEDDDDDDTTIPDTDVPLTGGSEETAINDEEVPLAELPEETAIDDDEVPLAELPEEAVIEDDEVPLADVPETGDISAMWYAVTILSACGLMGLHILKKRAEA